MDWTWWILSSAVFLALYDLAKKASVRGNAVLPVLLCSTCFGCAAFVSALAAAGRLADVLAATDGRVAALAVAKSGIVATSWIFTFCALRTLPITIATPIRASAPALVFVLALVLYGEVPTATQAVGMLAVFAGLWLFSWAGRYEGIDFLRNRAVWCAVAGACCSAMSSLWDKYVFQVAEAPVESVQLFFQLGLVAVYAGCLAVTVAWRRLHGDGGAPGAPFDWRWTIPLVGVLLAAADWLYFTGLAVPGVPISVASLMRRLSVGLTFVLGAAAFRETNLKRKALALGLLLAGTALLCL
ncbi:MAG: EamA family transporter [Kiritimatiellae bacterium]|nr:EamA family transporter [Kiritimatiellia bacterium]